MTHDILAFSDVHLGQDRSNVKDFSNFVEILAKDPPRRLVILGDLLDFWRRTNAEVLLEHKVVLDKLFSLPSGIYYVVGNHDYLIGQLAQRSPKDGRVRFSKDLRLESGGKHVFLTHGYDLDVQITMEGMGVEVYEGFATAQCRANDTIGGFASLIWDGLSIAATRIGRLREIGKSKTHSDEEYKQIRDITKSGTAHLLCGALPGDLLVYGHTHWPEIWPKNSSDATVANTGSWCTEDEIPMHNTYVTIDDGKMAMNVFDPDKPL